MSLSIFCLAHVELFLNRFLGFFYQIPVAEGDKGYGGFATLDVESVNLIKYPEFKEVTWQYANMTAGDCLFLPYSEYAANFTSTNIPLAGYIFLRSRFLQVDQSNNNVPYLPVYKLTFCSLKIMVEKIALNLNLGQKLRSKKGQDRFFV